MSGLSVGVRVGMLARSLTIQGSWNYETLIGAGFAFTLIPALRVVHAGNPEALKASIVRHSAIFNSHPYLATIAAGAVARMEADGADPEVIERFKSAVRGSLGSLGDRLIWMAWRPAALLLGISLLLAGVAWWAAVGGFLLVYNGLHLVLRTWGLRVGLENGVGVAAVVRDSPLQALATRAANAGALLAGLAVALFLGLDPADPVRLAAVALGATLGIVLGIRARIVAGVAVAATWALALILGTVL
jgi:PTS system mannose-specific IID component